MITFKKFLQKLTKSSDILYIVYIKVTGNTLTLKKVHFCPSQDVTAALFTSDSVHAGMCHTAQTTQSVR